MQGRRVRSQIIAAPGQDRRTEDLVRDFTRTDSRQRRVLVIGSDQPRNVASVGWLEDWPSLADFDVVIINLKTLDRVTLVKLSRVDKDRLNRMRSQLFDLLLSRGEIYCILAPFLAFGSYVYHADGSVEPEWSNLNWSPIGFSFTEIRGETVQVEGDVKFEDYLRQVAGWESYLNTTASLNYIEERLRQDNRLAEGDEVFWQSLPLAMNRYGKPLAASLCFGVRQIDRVTNEPRIRMLSDYLHLLPPTTKIPLEQGIDLLLEEAKGLPARTLTPDWADLYHVPGEDHLQLKLNELARRIKSAEREQKKLFQSYRELLRSKALLFEHGENLKRIVGEVLHRMGFAVKPHRGDTGLLVLYTRHGRMLLDVAGRSGPAERENLQVLVQHAAFAQEEDGRIWKGVLVFNHYRLDDPSTQRPAAFPREVVALARDLRFGLVTTEGLYATYCAVMRGSMLKEEFEDRLWRSAGIVPLPAAEIRPVPALTIPFTLEGLDEGAENGPAT